MTFSPGDDDRLWREPEKDGWFRFSSPLKYVIFIIILIALIVVIWYLMSPARRSFYNPNELALIRADETPYKVKAQDQGIPGVKHQDKLVYSRIRGDQNNPPVEHILPDPEPPLVPVKDVSPSVKMVEQYTPNDVDFDKSGEPTLTEEPMKEAAKPISSIEDLIDDTPEEKPISEKKVVKGNIFIQLASLKSFDLAESEWSRISKKHKDILANFEPTIQKVDLGADQGIYYRLRTGPFESKEEAKKACSRLKERKVECLVIH